MKFFAISLLLLYMAIPVNAQTAKVDFSQPPPNMDTLIPRIIAEKNDSTRYYLVLSALTISETNPVMDMYNSEKILLLGNKINDPVCKVLGLGCLGYDYRALGNNVKSLQYNLEANKVAEKSKNNRLIAFAKLFLAINYLDLNDFPKAVAYNKASMEAATHFETNIITVANILDMGIIYAAMGKTDSALIYTQKAYETGVNNGITYWLAPTYMQLGDIQAALKSPGLAVSFMRQAIAEAYRINSPKYKCLTYSQLAKYYLQSNQRDSAESYARKAVCVVEHTAFSTMRMDPARMLLDIYRDRDRDSAFKYSEIYRIAQDSLYNIKAIQQAQLMTLEEDSRQAQLALEKSQEAGQRKTLLQYSLIALGIVMLLFIYFLLSRSIITNSRLIRFFGVIALLIVFEFLNLLLHPLLEKITNHSPVLMLLALVGIAAILIPLHHRIEKWAITRMVEKNKEIRIAAAKKTIASLENPE